MRNLIEYPVTTEEILELLDALKMEFDGDLMGDMRPAILMEAAKRICEHEQEF